MKALSVPLMCLSVFGAAGSTRGEASEVDRSVTCTGDLTLRVRRQDEMAEGESPSGDAIMAKAPLEMKLKNGSVTVEFVTQ